MRVGEKDDIVDGDSVRYVGHGGYVKGEQQYCGRWVGVYVWYYAVDLRRCPER